MTCDEKIPAIVLEETLYLDIEYISSAPFPRKFIYLGTPPPGARH